MTLDLFSAFFGWLTVLHLGVYLLTVGVLLGLRDWVTGLHGRLFDLQPEQIQPIIYSWLGSYKILILATALGPWLALQLI